MPGGPAGSGPPLLKNEKDLARTMVEDATTPRGDQWMLFHEAPLK